jgi:myo-inositol catabolism protein IolC
MEITSSALTGLFIGMVWALVKVVEYFVKKYGKEKYVSLPPEQSNKLNEVFLRCSDCQRYGSLTINQTKSLETIEDDVAKLRELHEVYDANHVPKWYVPSEILAMVKNVNKDIDNMSVALKDELNKISAGQSISVEKMSELITSQKLVTERLGDLITLWAKERR